MHEYSLMQDVVGNILEKLKKQPLPPTETLKEVSLKVGALDIHSEGAFCQAFLMLVKGTPLEGCHLQLTIEPGILKCDRCGYGGPSPSGQGDGHDPTPVAECPRCGAVNPILRGRGVPTIELVTTSSGVS